MGASLLALAKSIYYNLSNGPDKKERTKTRGHVGVQKGANFTIRDLKI